MRVWEADGAGLGVGQVVGVGAEQGWAGLRVGGKSVWKALKCQAHVFFFFYCTGFYVVYPQWILDIYICIPILRQQPIP